MSSPHRINLASYYRLHIPALLLPVAAAAIIDGWPALASIGAVLLSTMAALWVWRRINWRGRMMCPAQTLWMGVLLALALPPHLVGAGEGSWAILPAAGILLVILTWTLGALGSGRVHPVLAAYLILVILFAPKLTPHYVLKPDRLVTGNLFNAEKIDSSISRTTPWAYVREPERDGKDALYNPAPAAERLTAYTSGQMEPDRFSVSLEMVLRDQLPPLEDCLIGGEPAPMGMASALAVIVAGLFLLHRGLIDWRIPAFTLLAALAAFLILPVPVVITDMGAQWSWCAFRRDELGWPAMVTLANYELLASPLLFVTFFLATSPRSRPLSNGGRICYGLLLGFLAAGIQLYASVEVASYVALLLANLASPVLDKVFKPRPLV